MGAPASGIMAEAVLTPRDKGLEPGSWTGAHSVAERKVGKDGKNSTWISGRWTGVRQAPTGAVDKEWRREWETNLVDAFRVNRSAWARETCGPKVQERVGLSA